MDNRPSSDTLESNHQFPGVYQIKAIGSAEGGFPARVLAAVHQEGVAPGDVEHSVRTTKGGRHSAVTLEIMVQSSDQVRAIYSRIREVEGLALLL